MNKINILLPKRFATLTLIAVLGLGALACQAASVTMTLQQLSLDNVADAAGLWQHEGGKVFSSSGAEIGTYALHRRVTTSGTGPFNTAMLTMTVFLGGAPADPPHNFTIQGAHSFNSGRFNGSVSAASSALISLVGVKVDGVAGATLVLTN